jgi:hypothetical protein
MKNLLITGLIALCPCVLLAQNTASITLKITDSKGTIIKSPRITVLTRNAAQIKFDTNGNTYFFDTKDRAAFVKIECGAQGYKTQILSFSFASGYSDQKMDVTLKRGKDNEKELEWLEMERATGSSITTGSIDSTRSIQSR